jgi:hypothetical protein
MFVPFKNVGGDAAEDPEGSTENDRVGRILRRYSPEDLDRLNRIELAVMGTPPPLSEQFTHHPWYSPRHETTVVENLAALDLTENRVAFIEVAITADSEEDAHFYERTAELLRVYSDFVQRIDRVVAIDGVVMGLCAGGTLVVPLAADRALWNPETSKVLDTATATPPEMNIQHRRLLVSGTLSPLARAQIESRGVGVVENAFEAFAPTAGSAAAGGV